MSIVLNEAYNANVDSCVGQTFSHFVKAPVDYTIQHRFREIVEPIVPISDNTRTITFQIEPSPYFVNLIETSFEIELEIRLANGNAIPAISDAAGGFRGVAFENNAGGTIVKDLDINVNGVRVNDMTGNYGMMAYVLTVLGFSSDARRTKCERSLYSDASDPTAVDAFNPSAFRTRQQITDQSARVQLSPPIFAPICMQARAMVSKDVRCKV